MNRGKVPTAAEFLAEFEKQKADLPFRADVTLDLARTWAARAVTGATALSAIPARRVRQRQQATDQAQLAATLANYFMLEERRLRAVESQVEARRNRADDPEAT